MLDKGTKAPEFTLLDKDGKEVTFTKTGKVIYLSAADIDSLLTLQCDVSN